MKQPKPQNCKKCGTEFQPKIKQDRFCSEECRTKSRKESSDRKNDKANKMRTEIEKAFRSLTKLSEVPEFLLDILEQGKTSNVIRQALTAPLFYAQINKENIMFKPSFTQYGKAPAANSDGVIKNYKKGYAMVFLNGVITDSEIDYLVQVFEDDVTEGLYDATYFGTMSKAAAEALKKKIEAVLESNDERTQLLIDHKVFETDLQKAKSILMFLYYPQKFQTIIEDFCQKKHGVSVRTYLKRTPSAQRKGTELDGMWQ